MAKKNTAAAAAPEQLAIDIPEATRKPRVSVVPRAIIHPDPHQPRVDADADLRASIARNGIIQPITVRPHPERSGEYMIVDGERRWRGSADVLDELPVIIRRDQEDSARRLVTQVVANSGKALAPVEEAKAFRQIVEDTGMSISDAADLVGVPRSTFAERLRLLDLGPWLELLQAGEITISQAVRALVPLAGIPAKYHEQMIAKVRKDYRWGKRGGPGMSLSDFESLIRICYTPLMYPLKKSSSSWLKQPEFPTSKHDDECTCGAPKFELSGAGARACCGNPDWWRPKHRKAVAEKKAAEPKAKSPAKKALALPEGHTTARVSWEGDAPKGVTLLSTRAGTWRTPSGYHSTEPRFDPADLGELDPTKLVLVDWPNRRPGEYPVVGTRQAAAVKRATEAW
ncbi:MAG: ParB/RepB/Spo0J family partition protein, partial [Kofleriaceae bacterium]